MLGYKLTRIQKSLQGFDYESDALLIINFDTILWGTIFFEQDLRSNSLIPVRAEYEDPKTGVIKAVTL